MLIVLQRVVSTTPRVDPVETPQPPEPGDSASSDPTLIVSPSVESLPPFSSMPNVINRPSDGKQGVLASAFWQFVATIKMLKGFPHIALFLVASGLYNDGIGVYTFVPIITY